MRGFILKVHLQSEEHAREESIEIYSCNMSTQKRGKYG